MHRVNNQISINVYVTQRIIETHDELSDKAEIKRGRGGWIGANANVARTTGQPYQL